MKWTVGTKIGLGFSISMLILIAIGASSYRSANKFTETSDWVDHSHQVLESLTGLSAQLVEAESSRRGFILTLQNDYVDNYQAAVASSQHHLADVRQMTLDNPNQQHRLDVLDPMVAALFASSKQTMDVAQTKGADAARQIAMAGKGKEQMDAIKKIIGDMEDEEHALLKERSIDAQASAADTRVIIVAGTIAAFFLLLLTAFLITRNICVPLKRLTAMAEQIAGGDLNVEPLSLNRRDEVGQLAQSFAQMSQSLAQVANVARKIAAGDLRAQITPQSEKDLLGNALALMVDNLRKLTSQITDSVNILITSTSQISTTTTQLASSAAEVATAVSETTTTVEEVRQTAQLASQKARLVSDTAQKTSQISVTGTRATEETAEGIGRIRQQMDSIGDTMIRLTEQSQTIGQIVASVEDLAAQSNLLAVNASIEAAKAGDQGKGFAVVAQEVKSLAEQSQQATNQVRNILTDIRKATSAAVMATEQGSKAVESGVKQATQAGQSIQTLSVGVAEAAQAATQIAASSQQQLVGMDQVASAMENIKQASTQNLASSKQLEAAAHSLKELGHRLKETVAIYKV